MDLEDSRLEPPTDSTRETEPPVSSPTRRQFLGTLSGVAAATAMTSTVGLAPIFNGAAEAAEVAPGGGRTRAQRAYDLRVQAAANERRIGDYNHATNGDEERYPNRIGNFHKTLPHNAIGEVDPVAYNALLRALRSGQFADFEAIPSGGTGRLSNPLGGLAFNMEGPDSPAVGIATLPPPIASAQKAAEAAELYWEAYLRDVPFADYPLNPVVQEACNDLTRMRGYMGPRDASGRVTPQLLFRYKLPGALDGPIVSQLLYRTFSYDGIQVNPLIRSRQRVLSWNQNGTFTWDSGLDYLTAFAEWLTAQNGGSLNNPNVFSDPRYIHSVRDLGVLASSDTIYSGPFRAAMVLNALGVEVDDGNPYKNSTRQGGFSTFGLAHLVNLIGSSQKAERHTWYHKWFVHRHLRPEGFGGLVDNVRRGRANYPLHTDLLSSPVLDKVAAYNQRLNGIRFGTNEASFLLPIELSGGGPSHPSAPAGHAIAAGAGVTMLKAWFKEDFVLPDSVTVQPDRFGNLVPYRAGIDGPALTVGGELNKLAHNLSEGRNMSGVHWRVADNMTGLAHGEEVAIRILREAKTTYPEPNVTCTLTKFDGTRITI